MTGIGRGRLGALAGLTFVVLDIGGGVVHGSPPRLDATAPQVTAFYRDHHSAVLISLVLAAIGFVALLVMAAVVAGEFFAAGRRVAAGALLASIAAAAAVSILSGGVEIGVAQLAVHSNSAGFVRSAYVLATYLYPTPYLFVALAASAVAIGGKGFLPARVGWLTAIVLVLNVLGGISVGYSGFFASNDGGALVFAGFSLGIWVLVGSWMLWRSKWTTPADVTPAQNTNALSFTH